MFHLQDGLFFIRGADGSVTIEKYGEGQVLVFKLTVTPESWASVVASMSRAGETAETWQAALVAQVP